MAFQLVQKFDNFDYDYDRRGDVLDISFGLPAPAIALQVEDWLGIQVRINPPGLQGMTIVGFKKIFEKINQYAEKELPARVKRLVGLELSIDYDDASDTLMMRWESGKPSIFERLLSRGGITTPPEAPAQPLGSVYVEKTLPSMDIVGIKILEYTKCGPAALEGIFGAIIDTIFESSAEYDENVHLITDALVQSFDWQKFAALAT